MTWVELKRVKQEENWKNKESWKSRVNQFRNLCNTYYMKAAEYASTELQNTESNICHHLCKLLPTWLLKSYCYCLLFRPFFLEIKPTIMTQTKPKRISGDRTL